MSRTRKDCYLMMEISFFRFTCNSSFKSSSEFELWESAFGMSFHFGRLLDFTFSTATDVLKGSSFPFFFHEGFLCSKISSDASTSSLSFRPTHAGSFSNIVPEGNADVKGPVVDSLRFKVEENVSFLTLFPFERLFTLEYNHLSERGMKKQVYGDRTASSRI